MLVKDTDSQSLSGCSSHFQGNESNWSGCAWARVLRVLTEMAQAAEAMARWECNNCGAAERMDMDDGSVVCAVCETLDAAALPEADEFLQGVHSQREVHHREFGGSNNAHAPTHKQQRGLARVHVPSECAEYCNALAIRTSSLLLDVYRHNAAKDASKGKHLPALSVCKYLLAQLLSAVQFTESVLAYTGLDATSSSDQQYVFASDKSCVLHRKMYSLLPQSSVPLALVLLALHSLREPIMVSDLVHWAHNGIIVLHGAHRLRQRFSSDEIRLLGKFYPFSTPSAHNVRQLSSVLMSKIAEAPTSASLPSSRVRPLDVPAVIAKLCIELDLPRGVRFLALRLNRLVGSSIAKHMPATPYQLLDPPPEARCGACIVVAAKLGFGLGTWYQDEDGRRVDPPRHPNITLENLLYAYEQRTIKTMRSPRNMLDAYQMHEDTLEAYSNLCMHYIFDESKCDPEERHTAMQVHYEAELASYQPIRDSNNSAAADSYAAPANSERKEQEQPNENEHTEWTNQGTMNANYNQVATGIAQDTDDDSAPSSGREDGRAAMHKLRNYIGSGGRSYTARSTIQTFYAQKVIDASGEQSDDVVPIHTEEAFKVFLRQFMLTKRSFRASGRDEHIKRVKEFLKTATSSKRKLIWFHGSLIRYGVEPWDPSKLNKDREEAVMQRESKTKMFEREKVDVPHECLPKRRVHGAQSVGRKLGQLNAGELLTPEHVNHESNSVHRSLIEKGQHHYVLAYEDAIPISGVFSTRLLSFKSSLQSPASFKRIVRHMSSRCGVEYEVRPVLHSLSPIVLPSHAFLWFRLWTD